MLGQQLGEYVVRRFIGSGGMGIVYAGEHVTIGRKVAIKFIREEVSQGPHARDLLTEARAAGAIHHHGIIDIFGFGQQPGVGQYLVMEYLEGRPLNEVLQERGLLPLTEALALLCEVLDALSAAHAAGVIHRDLKPSNIFVVRQSNGAEYIKVLDFGLAKRSVTPEGTTPQTFSDVIVGTPQYMAPEQALGEEVGPQTDLYAVGVIAFELLTGQRPFSGRTHMEVVAHHLKTPAPAPSSAVAVPAEVDALVLQLLAKQPQQRPASAVEVGRRLRALLQSQEAVGLPVPGTSRSIPVLEPPPAAVSPQARTETMPPFPTPDSPQAGALPLPAVRGSLWKWGAVAGGFLLLALGGAMISGSTFASMASSPLPAATAAASPAPAPPAAQPEARPPSHEPAPATPPPEPAQPLASAPPPKPKKKTPAPAQPSAPAIASVQPSHPPPEQAPVQAATGTLHIMVKGAWADVWIDGQKLGRVPPTHSYTLSAGAHEVELRNPGLAPYQQQLVIPPGGTLTHKADLSPTP